MSEIRLLAVLIVVCALVESCVPSRAEVPRAEADPRTPVEVMEVEKGVLVERGNYHGVLEPKAAVVISAEVGGKVTAVPVDEGKLVRHGALLARLDEDPFRLAEEQAEQSLAGLGIRVEQLRLAISIERKALQAGKQQAAAAVEIAEARMRMVEKGARPEERKQVRAGMEAARAALDNARVERDRVKSLLEADAATQQMLDGAGAALDGASARYDQAVQGYKLVRNGTRQEDKDTARAMLKQASAALDGAEIGFENLGLREKELDALKIQVKQAELALEAAQLNRSRVEITSPMESTSVVSMRNIDPGEIAGPGMPLFELLDMTTMKLVLKVPGRDIAYIREGTSVPVVCVGDSEDAAERIGAVHYVGVKADSQNTTFPVEIMLSNAAADLRAGQVCEAFPELRSHNEVLVPGEVILDTEEGKVVMVVHEGAVREASVSVKAVRRGVAAVSDGLASGAQVVIVGERLIRDGDEVNVLKTHPPVRFAGSPRE